MEKILVVGGAGYIGSHCCKLLAQTGFQPIVYDNLSTGRRDFVRWGPLIEGDIRDRDTLRAALASVKPAAVMHFAALISADESVRAPGHYWDVNLGGTLSLLEAMHAEGCDKLVFSSSCAVYGQPEIMPVDEATPTIPINPYGASKLAAEWLIESYDRAHSLRSVRLRYFNACGADPDGETGYQAAGPSLVPLVLDVAAGRRANLSILGADYPTPDGTGIRDYIHVLDIASAHLAALDFLFAGGETAVVNLGSGHGASVAEVIAAVESVTGRKIATLIESRRSGDPARSIADPSLAANLLDWKADRSVLAAMISDAWRWHQSQFGVNSETTRV